MMDLVDLIISKNTALGLLGFAAVATVICVLRDAIHYFKR